MNPDDLVLNCTWEELERELLSLTSRKNHLMVRHLLRVTRLEATNLKVTDLLREIGFTILAADGSSFSEPSPSTEKRSLN